MEYIEISYPKAVYKVEALLSAGRRIDNLALLSLREQDNSFVATLTFEEGLIQAEKVIIEFSRLVIRYQEKIAVAERTSLIRQLILAQAFEPCENLEEVIGHVVKGENEQL